MTKILNAADPQALPEAIHLLQQGAVIAIPTDTVYGVAALALNATAVTELYRVKDRPFDKPIPVFVPTIAALPQVCQTIPELAYLILEQYWPGGLTVVLPASSNLPGIVTNYGQSVAVRIPNHPVVLDLLTQLDQPLAVTSANLSGQPNTQTAAAVKDQLAGRVPLILDAGPSSSDQASTILDLTQSPPQILRQGVIQLEATWNAIN
jgi:L-threonylcarbamoyladenylate synthase